MKTFLVQLFAFGKFYGEDSYQHGPFLIHADTDEGAVRFAVRELVASGKLNKDAQYSGKAVYAKIKNSWLNGEKKGLCPQVIQPYGHGFLFKWNKKTDKIELKDI